MLEVVVELMKWRRANNQVIWIIWMIIILSIIAINF